MRKIFLSVMIAMTCLSTVSAQNPQRERKHPVITPEKMVERMDRALDLTDEQEQKLTELYKDYFQKMKTLREGDKKEQRTERKDLRLDFNKEMNEILTAEQQQKWAEVKKAHTEKRQRKSENK